MGKIIIMKDYTIIKEDRKNFILRYVPKGDKIIVYYADGSFDNKLSNTEANIEYLNSIMEQQVANSNKTIHQSDLNSETLWGILPSIILGAVILTFPLIGMLLAVSVKTVLIVLAVIAAVAGSMIGVSVNNHNVLKQVLKDIEKSEYFLANEKILNDNIKKSETMLLKVRKPLAKAITKNIETNDRGQVLDINFIHSLSLEDLKTIKANIDRYNEFIAQSSQIKPMTRTRGKSNR